MIVVHYYIGTPYQTHKNSSYLLKAYNVLLTCSPNPGNVYKWVLVLCLNTCKKRIGVGRSWRHVNISATTAQIHVSVRFAFFAQVTSLSSMLGYSYLRGESPYAWSYIHALAKVHWSITYIIIAAKLLSEWFMCWHLKFNGAEAVLICANAYQPNSTDLQPRHYS